jgi:hypothetical protein
MELEYNASRAKSMELGRCADERASKVGNWAREVHEEAA